MACKASNAKKQAKLVARAQEALRPAASKLVAKTQFQHPLTLSWVLRTILIIIIVNKTIEHVAMLAVGVGVWCWGVVHHCERVCGVGAWSPTPVLFAFPYRLG